MSQHPMTAASGAKINSAKRHRMNQIYGTVAPARPIRKQPPTTTKGPNVFKRMIRGLVTWSMKDDIRAQEDIVISEDSNRLSGTGIRFEVYRANGGTVVETRRPDRRSGESVYELHVITDSQDVGQAIGQIITLESLKS